MMITVGLETAAFRLQNYVLEHCVAYRWDNPARSVLGRWYSKENYSSTEIQTQ